MYINHLKLAISSYNIDFLRNVVHVENGRQYLSMLGHSEYLILVN